MTDPDRPLRYGVDYALGDPVTRRLDELIGHPGDYRWPSQPVRIRPERTATVKGVVYPATPTYQAWDSAGTADLTSLPPDLTPNGGGWAHCSLRTGTLSPVGRFACTRRLGHTGRHAHGDGAVIRAVWP